MNPGSTREPEEAAVDREKTYFSISEVAELLDVRPHVLRYWETQFPMLRPRKGRSGSRMYREREVELARSGSKPCSTKRGSRSAARGTLEAASSERMPGKASSASGSRIPTADALTSDPRRV